MASEDSLSSPVDAESVRLELSKLLWRNPPRFPPPPWSLMLRLLISACLLVVFALAMPVTDSAACTPKTPLLAHDFADPCIVQDPSTGTWYAFASGSWVSPPNAANNTTTKIYKNIQAASAPAPQGPWTYLSDADPLPWPGAWTSSPDPSSPSQQQQQPLATQFNQTWAPSVIHLPSSSTTSSESPQTNSSSPSLGYEYVLYYSVPLAGNRSAFHCIGAATATNILGPYTPLETPIVCPVERGGAIDPSGFLDDNIDEKGGDEGGGENVDGSDDNTGGKEDGEGGSTTQSEPTNTKKNRQKEKKKKRYLLYKIDGNALGSGGSCGNGVAPFRSTPIMLQEVSLADGVTLVGDPVQLLDRDDELDGPLVEAPELMVVHERDPGKNNNTENNGDGDGDGDEGASKPYYVLFYSNHCWDGPGYSVNYAVASSGDVKGQYVRGEDGPLIGTGGAWNITAPGGASTARKSVSGGSGWFMVFHGNCEEGRCLFGAEMEVNGGEVVVS